MSLWFLLVIYQTSYSNVFFPLHLRYSLDWFKGTSERKAMGFSTKGGSCKSALKPIHWNISFEYSSIFMLHSGSTQETHSPSTSWQKCKCHKTPRSNGGHTGQDLELRLGKSLDWVVPTNKNEYVNGLQLCPLAPPRTQQNGWFHHSDLQWLSSSAPSIFTPQIDPCSCPSEWAYSIFCMIEIINW